MFDQLTAQPQDKILQLIQMYREDARDGKIDLGVGVYKDATGLTPVMRAVKAAEKKLWEVEKTKTYTGLAGEPAYHAAMAGLVLGDAVPMARVAAAGWCPLAAAEPPSLPGCRRIPTGQDCPLQPSASRAAALAARSCRTPTQPSGAADRQQDAGGGSAVRPPYAPR